MSNTQKKPVSKALTEEEKKAQIAKFFGQKRESFAQGILYNLCSRRRLPDTEEDGRKMVDQAVMMADYLIERLYTIKED